MMPKLPKISSNKTDMPISSQNLFGLLVTRTDLIILLRTFIDSGEYLKNIIKVYIGTKIHCEERTSAYLSASSAFKETRFIDGTKYSTKPTNARTPVKRLNSPEMHTDKIANERATRSTILSTFMEDITRVVTRISCMVKSPIITLA